MIKKILINFKGFYRAINSVVILLLLVVNAPLNAQSTDDILRVQAQEQMDEGKFGEAINLLNRYISANPQIASGYNLRGLCYENRKEYEKAVYDFRTALKLEPRNENIKQNLSRTIEKWESLLFNRIVGYKREIEINPEKAANYLEVGKCFKNLGEWEQAEIWYDKYLKREEPSADELIRYSEIVAKNNHISKGEPWLKKYTDKYPDDHRLWSRYGYFTMWLGKKKIAIEAFENALKLRPFFKEALDGYDLVRGKGYIYTVNDTTVRYNYGLPVPTSYEYPIDKYYRKLRKNPHDLTVRIKLTEELIKNDRFAEAEKQIKLLSISNLEVEKIKSLENRLEVNKESYYWQKEQDLEEKLLQNPADEKSLLELANIYAQKSEYDKAIKLLDGFKEMYTVSDKFSFYYALINSWAGNFQSAFDEVNALLKKNPNNLDYQLLFGKLAVWMNRDLDIAQSYLGNVLNNTPNEAEVLLSLSSLHLQKNDLNKAKLYLNRAAGSGAGESEVLQISKLIENQHRFNQENEIYSQLEQAREYLFSKECAKAINAFQKYLSMSDANISVKKELAEAYVCKGDFTNAAAIYDKLILDDPENYVLRMHKAKLLYWSGDYLQAQNEFYELSLFNPEDAEVKLFLGDCYTALKDYNNAKIIYSELLEISPDSYILNKRMGWIEGDSRKFPSHLILSPEANYFADNFDFLYSTYGLRFDAGLTDYIALGVSGYAGVLGSDSITNNISIFKGIVTTRFSNLVSASTALGASFFPANSTTFLGEATLKIEKPKVFLFSTTFYSMDAAQVLYSPFLVDLRLTSNVLQFQGNYITPGDWKFSGLYSFINVSDENRANKLQLRFGKIFKKIFGIGYEYFYYDVKDQTSLYWSPVNFESHSIWAEWMPVNNAEVEADIGGKLGYIPSEDFVLREFYATALFKLSQIFSVQARLAFSSTVQSGRGYSSTSFGISAFWSL